MNYYPFHVGDYRSSTAHLTDAEDLAYRRLIDFYMDTEAKIPLETQWVARRIRVDTEVLQSVLNDFFECTETGWKHERCEAELEHYRMIQERNRINGSKGGRPKKKNPVGTQSKPNGKPTKNQEPITNKEKTKAKKNFKKPTLEEVSEYCRERSNGIDAQAFIDHYEANGWKVGRNAMKDWKAAVRTWEKSRKERSQQSSQSGWDLVKQLAQ